MKHHPYNCKAQLKAQSVLIIKGTEHPEERLPIYKAKDVCPECGDEGTVPIKLHSVFGMNSIDICPICQGKAPKLDRNVARRCYGCGKEYKRHIVTGKTPLCPKCQLAENKARAKLHGMTF